MHCVKNGKTDRKVAKTFIDHVAKRLMAEWRCKDPEMERLRLEEMPKMIAVFLRH